MTPLERLKFLASIEGQEILQHLATLKGDLPEIINTLRRRWNFDQTSAAIEQAALRARGRTRFCCSDEMLFTPQGLEQASGERIARWRAGRFPQGATVLDLCCGCGGDLMQMAGRGPVFGVDIDPATAFSARHNLSLVGAERASVACADATALRLNTDAVFFDPSRRLEGKRVHNADHYAPSLAFAEEILISVPNLAVKVSPALEEEILESTRARVEFVSDHGECKEAILWYGDIGPHALRSATVLDQNGDWTLLQDSNSPTPELREPGGWLFEPNAAVVRSHLIAEVAAVCSAGQIDPQIAYLTADQESYSPFATTYRVIEWMPFNLKRLNARLRVLGRSVEAIKRRGVPLDPNELSRKLIGAGDRPTIVTLTRMNDRPIAILCERVKKNGNGDQPV